MRAAEYFDQLYSESDRYWWRDKDRYATDHEAYPYSLLTQQTLRLLADRPPAKAPGLPPGRALDLGAGEGSDSIRLALLGYQVDAVEISAVAAEKISRFAADADARARVRVTVADIRDFVPAGKYDVVICNGVLHYLDEKERVVTKMQEATLPGGIDVISLWSTYTAVPDCHDSAPVFCDDEEGVVTKLYQGWRKELVYFERDKIETSHSDLPSHRHSHIKLIARKPLAGSLR
jgi:tellurite methyltransferase